MGIVGKMSEGDRSGVEKQTTGNAARGYEARYTMACGVDEEIVTDTGSGGDV